MQTDNTVQAVLFDYGMVLSGPPRAEAWQRMQLLTQLEHTAFEKAYWAPRHEYDRGAFNGRSYWQEVAGHHQPSDIIDHLIAADTELWTAPNQPMIDWAIALQRAGVRTGILSNLGDAMMEGVLTTFPWIVGFHHCTWSHTLHLAKPEPAIYVHAAVGLETPPENILFLDDRQDNIAGAAAVGMQTLRYTNHEAFLQEMNARGLAFLLDPTPARA